MGTYGVTHIKKDNKIIPFSDSHDGYLSGMGLAGLLSIKYISDKKLGELFDNYTARKAHVFGDHAEDNSEEEQVQLSQRAIDEVIYQVSEDSKNDVNAINWITNALSSDIRTSVSGFGPLLYLNVHPHYGQDYDYCDYLIDLDNRTFSIGSDSEYSIEIAIGFDTIRLATDNVLNYFANDRKELLTNKEDFSYEHEILMSIASEEVATTEDKIKLQERTQRIIDQYFSLDPIAVDEQYKKEQEANELYRKELKDKESLIKSVNNTQEEENYGAFSIRNAREITPLQLRTVQAFLNRLEKLLPETAFLSTNADWGMNETYTEGGIRFFSPMQKNNNMHECFESVINIFESQFKVSFSIFSSTGSWGHEVKQTENTGFFGDPMGITPGPEQSYYSQDDIIETFNNGQLTIDTLNPFLGYHMKYETLRPILLIDKNEQQIASNPIFWSYLAILNHDIEVFDKTYPLVANQIGNLNEVDIETAKKRLLMTLADSKLIVSTILSLKDWTSLNPEQLDKVNTTDQFVNHLKTTSFFNDLLPVMNNSEKSQYGFGIKNKMK